MLRDIKGLNLTQQIAHHLGREIIARRYGDHNPIPSEAVLCEQLDVSRSAAREAVKSLAAKGLISSRARQGIRVLPESEWNLFDTDVLSWIRDSNPSLTLLREFTELRIAVEPEAAWLAARRQDAEERADDERVGKRRTRGPEGDCSRERRVQPRQDTHGKPAQHQAPEPAESRQQDRLREEHGEHMAPAGADGVVLVEALSR